MKNYLEYRIPCPQGEEREILIARLTGFGFEGFEESGVDILASAEEGVVNEMELEECLRGLSISFEKATVPGQNWNALWESNYQPVVVGDFACIRAHFHQPIPGVQFDIQVTPKMSFGTGHHATTRQMIELMQGLPIRGKRVFDFGTGTGVLAILASKMGAEGVEAIDNDEWSITNAGENIEVNQVGDKISLALADNLDGVKSSDIVLANINKHILMGYLPQLGQIMRTGGYLVLSGLLAGDEFDIEQAANNIGLKKWKRSELNNWIALVFR